MATDTGRNKDEARKQVEKENSRPESEGKAAHGTPEGGPSGTLPPNPVAKPGTPGGSPA